MPEHTIGAITPAAWLRTRTREIPRSSEDEAKALHACYAEGLKDGGGDRRDGHPYRNLDDPDIKDIGTTTVKAQCIEVYKKGYADGWNATSGGGPSTASCYAEGVQRATREKTEGRAFSTDTDVKPWDPSKMTKAEYDECLVAFWRGYQDAWGTVPMGTTEADGRRLSGGRFSNVADADAEPGVPGTADAAPISTEVAKRKCFDEGRAAGREDRAAELKGLGRRARPIPATFVVPCLISTPEDERACEEYEHRVNAIATDCFREWIKGYREGYGPFLTPTPIKTRHPLARRTR